MVDSLVHAKMKHHAPSVSIIVPCFNEAEVLPETIKRLSALLESLARGGGIASSSRVWFVDDGSKDLTWQLVEAASSGVNSRVCGIKLSRNRGHQIALLAGLKTATGDALISVDADLQDDLAVIPEMIDKFLSGIDIVYGVRSSRQRDTVFKRLTAETYYRLLRRLGVELIFNHADFRLMSRRSVEALRAYPESNIFLRGLIPQLGFPSATVQYVRAERLAGETKYPLRKMLALAWEGVTSFSAVPLRVITLLGFTVSIFSIAMGFWALYLRLTNESIPGWASIVIPLFVISGVQLLSLGIIGEYLAKIFLESKRRPHFFLDRVVQPESDRGLRVEFEAFETTAVRTPKG